MPTFTFHSGYILIRIERAYYENLDNFTFHSGYILIGVFVYEVKAENKLYIPLWLYIN